MNIIRACICVAVVGGASLRRRSTGEIPPCFLDEFGAFFPEQSLAFFVQKVNAKVNDLVTESDILKQTMKEQEYCIDIPDSLKEMARFINLSHINADVDRPKFVHDYCYNRSSFLEKMRFHYDMLNQLVSYFEELRKTAKDEKALGDLTLFQDHIYECMCKQKITLQAQYQDPISLVPSGDLSDEFVRYRKGKLRTCKQQTSEYVTVLDSQRIASYLKSIYSSFEGTSTPTCF